MTDSVSLRDYRSLLLAPEHRWTLVYSAVARLPYAMISLVVLFYTQERSGSFGWAGALSGAILVGAALGAVLQGKIIDAVGPTRPLLTASAAFACCVLLLALAVQHQWPGPYRIVCAFGMGLCQPNVAAASRAVWGRVVTDLDHVRAGAAYEALSLEAFFIVGPGLAGVLAIAGWTLTGLMLSAAMMVLGTLGFCRSDLVRRWPAPRQQADSKESGVSELQKSFGHKGLHVLMAAAAGLGICLGGVEVAIPAALCTQSSPGLGGLVLSGWTITSILFALLYGRRPWPADVSKRVPTLLAAFAMLIAATALPRAPLGASALILVAGSLIAVQPTTYSLALQHLVPDDHVAEGFSWILTSMTMGAAIGQFISGQVVELSGARTALACVGLLGLGAAIAVTLQRSGLTGQCRPARVVITPNSSTHSN